MNFNSLHVLVSNCYLDGSKLPDQPRIPIWLRRSHLPNGQPVATGLGITFKCSIGIHLGACTAKVVQHPHIASEVDGDIRQVLGQRAG